MENTLSSEGFLSLKVTSSVNSRPIENAVIDISDINTPDTVLEEVRTNEEGNTQTIELPAPNIAYSEAPSVPQPYSEYVIKIAAPGFEPIVITGAEILPSVRAIQNVSLVPLPTAGGGTAESIVIPPHTLFGDYPPKIEEDEIKPLDISGEIVLSEVVIPEYIVVHDGPPSDSSAKNYYVPYRDYIKNVASSEIYATWSPAAIYANILAIQSFTLNRVYTEWYRNKGYDFTITSSTAYDHKWIYGRNIFDTINSAVDDIFNNYLSRPGIKQPILTQYCDGKRVTCPGLMSQWGYQALAEEGYSAVQILRNFYGSSIYINETDIVSGVPLSWPGYTLTNGSAGNSVRTIQQQLNTVADIYYSVPNIAVDGIYGPATSAAVSAFQSLFDLPVTGNVDFATWYKISAIYVALSRIAEYS